MDTIDVRFAAAHGLWTLGAAIVLAAFSFFDWLASAQGRPRREVWQQEIGWKRSMRAGLLLMALGFLLVAMRWLR